MHESGQRELCRPSFFSQSHLSNLFITLRDTELNQLTGIAAILTFPLDIEVVEAEEREAEEQQKRREEEEDNTGETS